MNEIKSLAFRIHQLLYNPFKVLMICLFILVLTVVSNGTLFKLWNLNQSLTSTQQQIFETQASIRNVNIQIKQSKDSTFLQRQAFEKMDLVGEHDLIFLFSE